MTNFKEITDVKLFKGHLDGRPVLVRFRRRMYHAAIAGERSRVIYNIAITASMSHLKNNLKLIGCCLQYDIPATVYEYIEGTMLSGCFGQNNTLSWSSRVKILREIASVVVYLHTCFPLPIIHRDTKPSTVIIGSNGVSKLVDYTFAIHPPKGESKLHVSNISGLPQFLAPEYFLEGIVSTKIDVYSFGILLLVILTGKYSMYWPEIIVEKGEIIRTNVDPRISNEVGLDEFEAIKCLILQCTEKNADDGPEMIYVARRLRQIEKVVCRSSCR